MAKQMNMVLLQSVLIWNKFAAEIHRGKNKLIQGIFLKSFLESESSYKYNENFLGKKKKGVVFLFGWFRFKDSSAVLIHINYYF